LVFLWQSLRFIDFLLFFDISKLRADFSSKWFIRQISIRIKIDAVTRSRFEIFDLTFQKKRCFQRSLYSGNHETLKRARRKRKRHIETVLFREIYSASVIQFLGGQLHILYGLQQLALFETLLLRQISPGAIFTWRRDHVSPFIKGYSKNIDKNI